MIMIVVSMQILLPLYAILGLVAPFGLVHQWELWLVAIYHGMLLGAMQSFSRVFYSEMLPKGRYVCTFLNFRESEFFSLYALTDKGASWIGPLVVGAITDSTHEIRYSFFFLLASMIVALFIISTVNPEKGRNEAADLSRLTSD
jgi:UMF1 family MFS transporter